MQSVEKTGAIATAENNIIMGRLGSAIAETLAENYPIPMQRIGVGDTLAESRSYLEVIRKYSLSAKFVTNSARQVIARKS